MPVRGVFSAEAGGAGTAGVEKGPAVAWGAGHRDLLAFSFAVFCRGSVECREDMGAVGVEELADLLEAEFVAKVAH